MKKRIVFLIITAMIVSVSFTLAGCKDEQVQTTTPEPTQDKMTVTVVVEDNFGDKSFYDSAKEGLKKLQDNCNVDGKTIECGGENFEQQLRNAADESDVVIPVGEKFDSVDKVAADYPDVKFIWCDNEAESKQDNLICITYAASEGGFLAGYIAAKTSITGTVGIVGGKECQQVDDFITGYRQGARYADGRIIVLKSYIGDYESIDKAKNAAINLHDKGADVIMQAAGNAGLGVFDAAKENNFFAIGVDSDQKFIDEEHIICSVIKNIGDSIYTVTKEYIEDPSSWKGSRTWHTGMEDGFVDIGYGSKDMKQQVNDELKKAVQKLKADIIEGKITVGQAE